MTKLNVIVRTEANLDGNGYHWVAVFPDDPVSRPGRMCYTPFVIRNGKVMQIGPFGEMTLSWYYGGTKYVDPMTLDSYGVCKALQDWYYEESEVELVFKSKLLRSAACYQNK